MARLYRFLDWFSTHNQVTNEMESRRRQRLLVIVSLGLFPVCLLFAFQFYSIQGYPNPITVVLLTASGSFLLLPLLLRLTHSYLLPAALLMVLMITVLVLLVFSTGGINSPALIWLPAIPMMAIFMIGSWTGIVAMGVVAVYVVVLYLLEQAGFAFPPMLSPDQIGHLNLVVTFVAAGFGTLLLISYEVLRQNALSEVKMLSSAVEHNPNMILIYDTDGLIEYLSSRFTQITGYSPDEFIGTPVSTLGGSTLELNKEIRRSLAAKGGTWQGEFQNRKKSGELYWVNASIAPITDLTGTTTHFVEVQEDITGRKASEEQILLQAAALESAANATVITDRTGKISWVNAAFTELSGYQAKEVIGQYTSLFKSGEYGDGFYQDLWQTIMSGEVWQSEIVNRHKDGHLYTEEMSITPVSKAGGEVSHFIAIKKDITERKRAEAIAHQRNHELALLNRLVTAAASDLATESVLEAICRELVMVFEVSQAAVAILDDTKSNLKLLSIYAQERSSGMLDIPLPVYDNVIIQYVLTNRVPVAVTEAQTDRRTSALHGRLRQQGLVSLLILPLVVRDQVLGIFGLATAERREFGEEEIALASNAIAAAAQALENARLFTEMQRRADELETLRQASLQLTSSLEQEQVLKSILRFAIQLSDAKDAHVFLYDEQKLSFAAVLWADKEVQEIFTQPRPGGVTETVANSGKRLVIPDVDTSPLFKDWRWGGAIVGLPLAVEGRILGVMNIAFNKPRAFEENELRILDLLAAQAAVALENTRLFNETRRRAEELEAMAKVSSALRTAQTQSAMMPIVVNQVFELLDAEGIALVRHDPKTGENLVEFARGDWVGVNGLRLLPGDLAAEPWVDSKHSELKDAATINYGTGMLVAAPDLAVAACVPLITQEETIGVLWVGREEGITQREFQLLTAIADIAGNAIQRAILHEQALHYAADLEQRVAERTAELSVANAELARASRIKDEFLTNMSHELRTPLSNILLRVEMLQEERYGPLSQKQVHSLATVEESGRHLLQLINDILDVSKIEAGKLDLDVQPAAADSICHASLRLVGQMAKHKQIQIQTDILPATLQVDSRRLKQVLVNLLANAVKFTPRGGQIGLETILNPEEETLHLAVWDTGVGISSADIWRLFEPFVQLKDGVSHMGGGTGLGLTLVRRLTEMHSGSVSVESAVGEGSRFTISLPWTTGNQTTNGSEMAPAVEEIVSQPAGTPGTLLLVEEIEAMNSALLLDYLNHRGYRVVSVRDGVDASRRAAEHHFDLIIMNIQMPGKDGLEVIRQIHAANSRSVPIVVLSALAIPEDRQWAIKAGVSEYLRKPVSPQKLAQVIAFHLDDAKNKKMVSS